MRNRRSHYLATSKAFLIMFALTLLAYLLGYMLASEVAPRPLDAPRLAALPVELLGALTFYVTYLVGKHKEDGRGHSPL